MSAKKEKNIMPNLNHLTQFTDFEATIPPTLDMWPEKAQYATRASDANTWDFWETEPTYNHQSWKYGAKCGQAVYMHEMAIRSSNEMCLISVDDVAALHMHIDAQKKLAVNDWMVGGWDQFPPVELWDPRANFITRDGLIWRCWTHTPVYNIDRWESVNADELLRGEFTIDVELYDYPVDEFCIASRDAANWLAEKLFVMFELSIMGKFIKQVVSMPPPLHLWPNNAQWATFDKIEGESTQTVMWEFWTHQPRLHGNQWIASRNETLGGIMGHMRHNNDACMTHEGYGKAQDAIISRAVLHRLENE